MIKLNDDILLNVSRPARYIGREHNMIKKEWGADITKVCLCYPDTYEIGMSHLGLKILYHILNKRKNVLCERSFAPWFDMEKVMLDKKIPLFSLESRMPLAEFDIIGFSLQHELTYSNLLNMLYLSGIPLKSEERPKRFPLIIAGGVCAFNPQPLADFIDAFLIGDGEEAIIDIVETYKRFKTQGVEVLRKEISGIEGVYVPSLYKGCAGPEKIKKRTVKELRREDFPTDIIVPYIPTIHDRITLEIMRGCPNRCRFCQARSIYTPARIRSCEDVIHLAQESYRNTGLDEISLMSLSSSNYPGIEKLLKDLTGIFAPLGVGITFPSLRVEKKLQGLPSLMSIIKKSGLTFAPEAASERMLRVINKNIKAQDLFDALREAYRMGWQRVKLYFMIGLPLEEQDDLEAIVEFADRAAMLKKEVSRYPAEVTISVSSFIPKPHTPFQWERMAGAGELKEKQAFLLNKVSAKKYLKLKMHGSKTSILEAVFSRGDERLGKVLLNAWENGARFDAWSEAFNSAVWAQAFLRNNLEESSYLGRRDFNDVLPWEHIYCGIEKEDLIRECKSAGIR